MTEENLQRVMHEMPYGLYIIGSKEAGTGDGEARVNGMMADWVMQVSFDPRLVAVSFENDSHTLGNVREHRFFTANLLSAGFLLSTPINNGIVVRTPTANNAHPAPWRLLSFILPASNRPAPAPRATRVPAIRMISGTVNTLSFITCS